MFWLSGEKYLTSRRQTKTSRNMVNQKLISFKISLQNLEDIDRVVIDSRRNFYPWTTRNEELNRAVSMYVEYMQAKFLHNSTGDSSKIREWKQKYLNITDDINF